MDAYEILLKVHRIGSRISGTVVARDEPNMSLGTVAGQATLKTESAYPALLPYAHLLDELSSFSPKLVPEVGAKVDAVVFNFVDGTLYLSARPNDLSPTTIQKWQLYYDYIHGLRIKSTPNYGQFLDFVKG